LHPFLNIQIKQEFFMKRNFAKSFAGAIIDLKKFSILIPALLIVVITGVSCKKDYSGTNTVYPGTVYSGVDRKIRFQLYTNQDFSGNTSVINFSLFVRNASNLAIFDSSLASMQLKDIPDAAHKLVIEKTLPGYGSSDFAAGFRYEIQNVGISWFTDTSKAGNALKIIDYAFQ
jgi:hypothetical protein